jgi:tetratricopeptide (TPR) repeat protein
MKRLDVRHMTGWCLAAWFAAWSAAQQPVGVSTPELSEAAIKAIEAPYLSDEERRDLRVFHGVWRDGDLNTPGRRATAALIRGAIDDPSLSDPAVAVEDRAEGAAMRGELEEALRLLEGADSLRAIRIRAEALEGLGRYADAAAALGPLEARLSGERANTASDLVEGVRGLMVRSRVRAQESAGGGDFKLMLSLLARARTELDRLYWPAYVVEAELLYAKDNRKEAGDAAKEALRLNPRAAVVWAMLGQAAVDGFNFEGAEQAAARLRALAEPGVSVCGALVLARGRLRQNDPEGAVEALEPALARYPRARALRAVRAAAEALRYDFAAVDRLLAEFDALSPGSGEAYYEVGRALSEARQYEASGRYLTEAVVRGPYRAEPIAELGLMLMQAGRDEEAEAALAKSASLDPFNSRAGNSLKLVRELRTHATVESDHFIVRYKPGPDEVLAREMPALLETMRQRVSGRGPGGIDFDVPGRTLIDLMPDHRGFAVRIAGITRIHTMAAATGPLIAMESPREGGGQSVGTYDWLRVVRHEYTHTVTLARTNNRIPHWFTEAAAVYLEDAPRDYATCRLLEGAYSAGALFDLSQINIAFVRPRRPTDRSLAYAQGHWMYQFILERWGERAPLDLMDLYARGEREAAAFRKVLGVDQDQFLADFKEWAGRQLASWGMGVQRPTIKELLLEELASGEKERAGLERDLAGWSASVGWAGMAGEPVSAWSPVLPVPDREMIGRWLDAHPTHPDVLELAVRAALDGKDEATAETAPLLERYAAARPVDPMPHKLLARLYLSGGVADRGADAAVPHLEYLDAREQRSSAFAVELARRYAARGEYDKALAKARRATIVAPFDPANRELLAGILVQAGDYAGAEGQIRALIAIEPDREIHRKRLEAVRRLAESRGG